ncbi:MAG: sugar phosphate isomerase/epimerase [Bryobacterales bacterium]|nr:sugar phosphate isomerase/epimerase [Bryobacterales bacterium]
MRRRNFLNQAMGLAAMSAASASPAAAATGAIDRRAGTRIKIGLNAYSFNAPLRDGSMTLDDMIDFCAAENVDAVDATGYYFPGYPKVPNDEFIYDFKRKAFLNGVTVSGTGVRNDFALDNPVSRAGHVQLVKNWVDVTQKLGADVLRVFSGRGIADGSTFEATLEWMVPAFQECAEYAGEHGIILGLQHHDDFLKTADETIELVERVSSDWFSVILDVGSLRQRDVYEEIEKLVPYACTWQIKEQVWYGEQALPIDLPRLRAVIERTGYRGFLPVEALGRVGTPTERVSAFLARVRAAFL